MTGRGASRTRSTQRPQGCKACAKAACCDCCNNWCHICGVAKCRAPRTSKYPADLNTQYHRDYPPKHVDMEIRRPGQPPLQSMPFYGITTNQADYTPKKGRSQSARPADVPIPAHRLDDSTTYNAFYPPKRADLEVPPAPVYPHKTAPFYGASIYNTDYVPRKVRPWTAEPLLPGPVVPLEGVSEYKDEFYKKPIPPLQPRPAMPLLPSSHVPTITTYGHDYVPKPFESRERLQCCDDPRHPAQHVWKKKVPCHDRPWSTCSSCANGTCGLGKTATRFG